MRSQRKRPGYGLHAYPAPYTKFGLSVLKQIDRAVLWCFRHWLAFANAFVLIYGGLPWLSPVLIELGYTNLGKLLFYLYTPLCHQRPTQSFFLLGHQVAFCHRESAMYISLFMGGLLYAWLRQRIKIRPISPWITLLLLMPLAFDGTTHLINELLPFLNLRSDMNAVGSFNWWLRMLTGVLFGVAFVLGVYPRLDQELGDIVMDKA